jgi:hypothetical protein
VLLPSEKRLALAGRRLLMKSKFSGTQEISRSFEMFRRIKLCASSKALTQSKTSPQGGSYSIQIIWTTTIIWASLRKFLSVNQLYKSTPGFGYCLLGSSRLRTRFESQRRKINSYWQRQTCTQQFVTEAEILFLNFRKRLLSCNFRMKSWGMPMK